MNENIESGGGPPTESGAGPSAETINNAVQNFAAMTDNYDPDTALKYLEQCGWDEMVLTTFVTFYRKQSRNIRTARPRRHHPLLRRHPRSTPTGSPTRHSSTSARAAPILPTKSSLASLQASHRQCSNQ